MFFDREEYLRAAKRNISKQVRNDSQEVRKQLEENLEKFKLQDTMVFTIKCEFRRNVYESKILDFVAYYDFPVTTSVNVVPLQDNLYEITIKKNYGEACIIS